MWQSHPHLSPRSRGGRPSRQVFSGLATRSTSMLFTPVLTGSYFELIYYIAPRSSYVDRMSGWPSSNGMIITTAHPLSNQYSPDRVYHLLTRELYHSGLFFYIRDPSQILDRYFQVWQKPPSPFSSISRGQALDHRVYRSRYAKHVDAFHACSYR